MFDNSLLNVLQASWKKWDNPSFSVKPVEPNEYIVREPYEKVRKNLNIKMIEFLEQSPNPS